VRATEKNGHIVLLRLKDTHSLLPVFIGEFECGALVSQINKKPTVRLWLALLHCASDNFACHQCNCIILVLPRVENSTTCVTPPSPVQSLPLQASRTASQPALQLSCCALLPHHPPLSQVQGRPLTHDLMKNTLEALGFRVTKVRITALVGNTYHARVHYARARGLKATDGMAAEVDVDARPSGARPRPCTCKRTWSSCTACCQ
jgi:bifunctional DNase/RNase